MKILLIDKVRGTTDKRYCSDVFEGIPDPTNIDGHEIDVFVAMSKSLISVPRIYKESLVFQADHDALAMMRRQYQREPIEIDIDDAVSVLANRGFTVTREELAKRRRNMPPLNRPSFADGENPLYRGIPIEMVP